MYPILARYGPFFLNSYTVVMAMGIVAGLALALYLGRKDGIESDDWITGLLIAAAVGLVAGRIVFIKSELLLSTRFKSQSRKQTGKQEFRMLRMDKTDVVYQFEIEVL